MLVAVVNRGIAFTVPPVVVTFNDPASGVEAVAILLSAAIGAPLFGGAASTSAEGGNPPIVSASAAFNA